MPIYEYRCSECQQLFEEWCKHVEENSVPHACPICKGQAHRIISNTSFALKGGGWYVTEYGSRKSEGANCSKDASASGAAPAAGASPCASGACPGAASGSTSGTAAAKPATPTAQ